jgi:hypothetical protein
MAAAWDTSTDILHKSESRRFSLLQVMIFFKAHFHHNNKSKIKKLDFTHQSDIYKNVHKNLLQKAQVQGNKKEALCYAELDNTM